jgi:tetratricopeptide (TPR) repeat protein
MRKINLYRDLILIAAITCTALISVGIKEPVTAADIPANSEQKENTSDERLGVMKLVAGIGIPILAAGLIAGNFFYQKRRRRAINRSVKIDRFQAEFFCGPLADYYAEQYNKMSLTPSLAVTSPPSNVNEINSDIFPRLENPKYPESNLDLLSNNVSQSLPEEVDTKMVHDRYLKLISEIVEITLKGEIRSPEYLYQILVKNVHDRTGEIFKYVLVDLQYQTQREIESLQKSSRLFPNENVELLKSRGMRTLNALSAIEKEYFRWQKGNYSTVEISQATQQILACDSEDYFTTVLQLIDLNKFHMGELQKLSQYLKEEAEYSRPESNPDRVLLKSLAIGITHGLESWQKIEPYLVSWIDELPNQKELGFFPKISLKNRQPWATWMKKISSYFPEQLFDTLASDGSITDLIGSESEISLSAWVELAILFQCLQRGLVRWFDQQAYNLKRAKSSSISTFLTFAVIWYQLSNGCQKSVSFDARDRAQFRKGCFYLTVQILQSFAQCEYFPLYGGVFTLFSKDSQLDGINYLGEPIGEVQGNQEKARLFTLFGYSQRVVGKYEEAKFFHQEALKIAQQVGDIPCKIANLNHISRIYATQKNYNEAMNYSQRALVLAREVEDKLGEANALANSGYSQVFSAHPVAQVEPDFYENTIEYLKQGLNLSETLADRESQALCCNSLGIIYIMLEHFPFAIQYLEKGAESAKISGDLYLQGFNFAYLAEAFYRIKELEKAVYNGCLGMYLLEKIAAVDWCHTAHLMSLLQEEIGAESFQKFLRVNRDIIIAVIGVDGYDHLPQLLEQYQCSLAL